MRRFTVTAVASSCDEKGAGLRKIAGFLLGLVLSVGTGALMNAPVYGKTLNVESIAFIRDSGEVIADESCYAGTNTFYGTAIKACGLEAEYKRNKTGLYHSPRLVRVDGEIKLISEFSNEYLTKTWFMDTDGRWYAFDRQGNMLHGLIVDSTRNNTTYILSPERADYGALCHTNGVYKLNGKLVYLMFNNVHDGSFGAVVTDLRDKL